MSSAEYAEWRAYDKLNPIGGAERVELVVARLCALTYNLWRGKGKEAVGPDKYLPHAEAGPEETPEEEEARMMVWARTWNAQQAREQERATRGRRCNREDRRSGSR